MPSSSQQLKALFKQLNSKNIVYNKVYYRLTGSVPAAVFLSHMMYLFSDIFGGREFYQSDEQIKDSLGFSDRTLRTAKQHAGKWLVATKKGVPAKNHWVVLEDQLIDDLLNLPAPETRRSVTTSRVENDTHSDVENDMTGDVENVTTNNKRNKNKRLRINNNSVVNEKIIKKGEELGVNKHHISQLAREYPIHRIEEQLAALLMAKNVTNPVGWLIKALKGDYSHPKGRVANISPCAPKVWDESEYLRDCREREKLRDPIDWREEMLQSELKKLKHS